MILRPTITNICASFASAIFCLMNFSAIVLGQQNGLPVELDARIQGDLRFVPTNAVALGVVRPAAIFASLDTETQELLTQVSLMPVRPDQIERIVAIEIPAPREKFVGYALVVELAPSTSATSVARMVTNGAEKVSGGLVEIYMNQSILCVIPDSQTLLIGSPSQSTVFECLESEKKEKGQLRSIFDLSSIDKDSQLYACVDVFRQRDHVLAKEIEFALLRSDNTLPQEAISVCALQLQNFVLSLSTSRPEGLRIEISPRDKSDATEAEQDKRVYMELLEMIINKFVKEGPTSLKGEFQQLESRIRDFVNNSKVESGGGKLVIQSTELPSSRQVFDFVRQAVDLALRVSQIQQKILQLRINMRQIGLAIHNSTAATGMLPQDIVASDGTALLSWRVRLLPHLEQNELFEKFHLDEAWDSPHNLALLRRMPAVFADDQPAATGKTRLLKPTGKGTVAGDKLKTLDEIRDGLSNTIAVVQTGKTVPWSKPEDFPIDLKAPKAVLREGSSWSVLYNASLHEFSSNIEPERLLAALNYEDAIGWQESKDGVTGVDTSATPPRLRPPEPPPVIAQRMQKLKEAKGPIDQTNMIIALGACGRIYPQRSMNDVMRLLSDYFNSPDSFVRLAALQAADEWKCGANVPIDKLLPLVKDSSHVNQWLANDLIAHTGNVDAFSKVLQLPSEYSDYILMRAEQAVHSAAQSVFVRIIPDLLAPQLKSQDAESRRRAVAGFSSFGTAKHRPLLEAIAQDPDEQFREFVQQVLENVLPKKGPIEEAFDRLKDLNAAIASVAETVQPPSGPIEFLVIKQRVVDGRPMQQLTTRDLALIAQVGSIKKLKVAGSRITDEGLAHLVKLQALTSLDVSYCHWISPKGFEILSKLPKLESFTAARTQFGEEGATAISQLKRLKSLELPDTKIKNADFLKLCTLPELESLMINNTLVSDAGLAQLGNLSNLQRFYFSGTAISDASIEHLLELKKLRLVNDEFTAISYDGQKQLSNLGATRK